MPKGISINIGLNNVDASLYNGWSGKLNACEADARAMATLAKKAGFETKVILTDEATSANVTAAISDASKELGSDDILFLTYSGHGGQVPDTNGEEPDGMDETWVLYDRQLIDDELYSMWFQFQPGTRILVLSDSCHSGSVVKLAEFDALGNTEAAQKFFNEGTPGVRAMPLKEQKKDYEAKKEQYDEIQRTHPNGELLDISAPVMLISGCQDEQLSSDGARNGLFTATLLKVWDKGNFKGTYTRFYREIAHNMPLWQQPAQFLVGDKKLGVKFKAENPFSLAKRV